MTEPVARAWLAGCHSLALSGMYQMREGSEREGGVERGLEDLEYRRSRVQGLSSRVQGLRSRVQGLPHLVGYARPCTSTGRVCTLTWSGVQVLPGLVASTLRHPYSTYSPSSVFYSPCPLFYSPSSTYTHTHTHTHTHTTHTTPYGATKEQVHTHKYTHTHTHTTHTPTHKHRRRVYVIARRRSGM